MISCDDINEVQTGETCKTHGNMTNAYIFLVANLEGKLSAAEPKWRFAYNIEIYLTEIRLECGVGSNVSKHNLMADFMKTII
jgi:hypothetical protein